MVVKEVPLPFGDDVPDDWTFYGASTREGVHCYHDYPARMIPPIASKLIKMYGAEARLLFDPYCGTGTSLVEGIAAGIEVIGTDINPLARLIATSKTTPMNVDAAEEAMGRFARFASAKQPLTEITSVEIPGIERLDFWFKPQVIQDLQQILGFQQELNGEALRLFFSVAFSETVRDCSNTRSNEFKLYRYAEAELERHNPDAFATMQTKLRRNLAGCRQFQRRIDRFGCVPKASVYSFNTVEEIPAPALPPNSVDIVVTSPPYGDSGTTVAYGQYSRLSAEWLGLPEPAKVDRRLMGGRAGKQVAVFPSPDLNAALCAVAEQDAKRAAEVSAFYEDLYASIRHIAPVVKPGGHVCYVVGNRKVKGVVLPTDKAVRDFFVPCGYQHITTHERYIPNKRMPLKNSPTNIIGAQDSTMTNEYIVILRREG